MGSNGAGKTTLFNIISGFIKPQKEEIFFNGDMLNGLTPYQRNRKGIGRTFQDLRTINKLSVRDNILLAMKNNPSDNIFNAILPKRFHFLSDLQMAARAEGIAVQFYLSEIQDALAGEISYGQQKLLTLACSVANGATLLLLDEPVAGIQPQYRNEITALIKQLKDQGKTIFIIEHNTDFISEVADKIFFLHDGLITGFSNIETFRTDKTVLEAYI